MVIKVDSKGVAKVTKYEVRQIACDAGFRIDAARDYREVRKTDYGYGIHGRYYRRLCVHDYLYQHGKFDGLFYDARKDPPQILMPCRCCEAEWLITTEEVQEAIAAINQSVDNG
jgi:hypothetical protein